MNQLSPLSTHSLTLHLNPAKDDRFMPIPSPSLDVSIVGPVSASHLGRSDTGSLGDMPFSSRLGWLARRQLTDIVNELRCVDTKVGQ